MSRLNHGATADAAKPARQRKLTSEGGPPAPIDAGTSSGRPRVPTGIVMADRSVAMLSDPGRPRQVRRGVVTPHISRRKTLAEVRTAGLSHLSWQAGRYADRLFAGSERLHPISVIS